jgi:hypothetical protein
VKFLILVPKKSEPAQEKEKSEVEVTQQGDREPIAMAASTSAIGGDPSKCPLWGCPHAGC